MRARLVKLRQFSWPDRFLLLEAGLYLIFTRMTLRAFPFRSLIRLLNKHPQQLAHMAPAKEEEIVNQITLAIFSAKSILPWHSTCMAEAIAAQLMLRRRHLTSTLYLGARLNEEKEFEAHAWLSWSDQIIIGGETSEEFEIFGTFPQERLEHEAF